MVKFKKTITVAVIIIVLFSFILSSFDHTHWAGLDKQNDSTFKDKFFNRLYFTMTTFSSTGYGDISPISKETRSIVMVLQFLVVVAILDYFV